MDKEEALRDFLKGLRIAINNASVYFREHPYYIKSVENLKQKIDTLSNFLNPIKIMITPESLFLDGRYWDKLILYTELSQLLHLRKLKSIEFRQGVSSDELIAFLSGVSLPRRIIFRQGGVKNILKNENIQNILIEELDYSQLLKEGEGEELKDIWSYFMNEAIAKNDQHLIEELCGSFEKVINNFKLNDFLEDEELRANLSKFLLYLKNYQKEGFAKCTVELFRSILKYRNVLGDSEIAKIRPLLKDLDTNDLTKLLKDELANDNNFDALSLNLFSCLRDKETHQAIAKNLKEELSNQEFLKDNPKLIKKFKDLLSLPSNEIISEVYRNTLFILFKDISFKVGFIFDRRLLVSNYRFIILNLVEAERNEERLNLILEKLSGELEAAAAEKDFSYLKNSLDLLNKKKSEGPDLSRIFEKLINQINESVEQITWEKDIPSGLEYFLDNLPRSTLNAQIYLNKIFEENIINPLVLKLFFRFFSLNLPLFYRSLEKKRFDLEFLITLIENLKTLDLPITQEVLKHIYSFPCEITRLEVLRAMGGLSKIDKNFLFSLLKGGSFSLKKEALMVLSRDEELKKRAIRSLLYIPNPFGLKNKLILRNMQVIDETGLKEAKDCFVLLAKKRFFWNRDIRNKAKEILSRREC